MYTWKIMKRKTREWRYLYMAYSILYIGTTYSKQKYRRGLVPISPLGHFNLHMVCVRIQISWHSYNPFFSICAHIPIRQRSICIILYPLPKTEGAFIIIFKTFFSLRHWWCPEVVYSHHPWCNRRCRLCLVTRACT